MKARALRLALGFVFSLVLGLAGGGAALADPPVWTVHGKDCVITLFGSVHILPKGLDWEPPALAAALKGADQLWFEIPIDPASEADAAALAQARALLPGDDSLSGHLSKAGQARLKAIAASLSLPADRLDRMQPWFVELVLSTSVYLRDGASADQGVEQQLAQAAPQAERKAFETPAQQIAMFADTPLAAQVASLEDTLNEITTDPQAYRRLLQAWLRGDDAAIYQHDIATLKHDAPALFEVLITERNAAWTKVLAARLKGSGRVVVVVGVGHLLGPDGVPAKLRALGFKVDGPKS
jgi:uncharacterized protein YbaP (TraB family)